MTEVFVVIALFLLTVIIVALSLGLVFTVQHNKKYGCVQGVCKQSQHGDFTSMAACKNNCRPPLPVNLLKCRPNPALDPKCNSFTTQKDCNGHPLKCKWSAGLPNGTCENSNLLNNLTSLSKDVCPMIQTQPNCDKSHICKWDNAN